MKIQIVGTPGYMAPEIYTPDYSYPVDGTVFPLFPFSSSSLFLLSLSLCLVWSFGVIMYELFRHGRKEAEDWPMYRVQDQLRHDFPFPIGYFLLLFSPFFSLSFLLSLFLCSLRPTEPEFETFTKIIQKCLHKTPKKRPTFEALKQEFLELSISSFR